MHFGCQETSPGILNNLLWVTFRQIVLVMYKLYLKNNNNNKMVISFKFFTLMAFHEPLFNFKHNSKFMAIWSDLHQVSYKKTKTKMIFFELWMKISSIYPSTMVLGSLYQWQFYMSINQFTAQFMMRLWSSSYLFPPTKALFCWWTNFRVEGNTVGESEANILHNSSQLTQVYTIINDFFFLLYRASQKKGD